jgi:hypothetical protein
MFGRRWAIYLTGKHSQHRYPLLWMRYWRRVNAEAEANRLNAKFSDDTIYYEVDRIER